MMNYKLFIDDERFPVGYDWEIARSSFEAKLVCIDLGMPDFISFDHDLGGGDTSIEFIKWLIDQLFEKKLTLPGGFDFTVHSQNPVGAENIRCYMENIIRNFKDV